MRSTEGLLVVTVSLPGASDFSYCMFHSTKYKVRHKNCFVKVSIFR